ncbi:MAG: bacteriohemerythrin [Solidesulfovibrio sp. DCME]|uniref:bacteriohemerythrin n=1 Tax=Solidesulfovibrio sp. DCME TaxID=3447380 RepID=UPI003D098309
MSIRVQILCSLGLMFLLSCAMFAVTWTITSGQETDGLVINLAGRQRMIIQKTAKEALAYAHQAKDGKGPARLAEDVRKRLAGFAAMQSLLARGGLYGEAKKVSIPAPAPETAALLDAAGAKSRAFVEAVESILQSGDGAASEKVLLASEEVVEAQDKAVAELQADTEASVVLLRSIQAGCMAVGAVVFVLVLSLLRRNFAKPLERLRGYARAVAGGDLKASPEGAFPPELAELRDELSRMVAALQVKINECQFKGDEASRHAAETDAALLGAKEQEARTGELLAKLNDAAGKARAVSESMLDATGNLLAQTEQVEGGARHQRDRMIETATAMEEMNATVLEVARNAASAAASADEAKAKAITGAAGVRSAVTSIETIRQRILELKESMTRLGQQADNIGHIMNVISDIADQTNLLALNAAIEAARAGDAGRGFAVVADEVRKLAEKTMTATKEVGDAVVSIQGQARENIAAVESAASGIEESTQSAAASGRFMDEIVGIVETTATQVESIATASEQQSATSEEINRAVDEVNRIAGDTADGMEIANQALSALSALAGELDDVIRRMTGEEPSTRRVVAAPRAVAASPRRPLPPSRPAPAKALPPASRPAVKARPLPASPARTAKALPEARPTATTKPTTATRPATTTKPAAARTPVIGSASPRPAPAAKASGNGGTNACSIGGGILQWDDSLAVGLREIDSQHQKLVQMICDLHEAMRSGKGKHQVEAILRELEEYAVEHFGYEEKLMEQYKYPGYLNHRKEHDKFVDQVIAFGNDFRANKAALTTEVMNFLKNWLVGHIKGTDKKYGPFFNERGVY